MWRDYLNDDEKSLASHDEEEEILSKQSKKDNKTSGESSDSKSSKVSNYKIESNFTIFFSDLKLIEIIIKTILK